MPSDLQTDVLQALAPTIVSKRLRATHHFSVGEDAEIILEGDGIRLRFVRDRNQVFVDFGATFEPHAWLDGYFLLQLLEIGESPFVNEDTSAVDLKIFGGFLERHVEQIEHLLQEENLPKTKRKIAELQEESAKQRFDA